LLPLILVVKILINALEDNPWWSIRSAKFL
jgi:hypothetical protein